MTLEERVARAICSAAGANPDTVCDLGPDGTHMEWWLWRTEARHAIDAIRAPLRALLLEHEPLAGPYIHDIVRAVDSALEVDP